MSELFTVEETAKLLKVHPQTIRAYIKKGILRAVKLRREYRIKEEDLNAFLENRSKEVGE